MKKIIEKTMDFLYPRRCPVCHDIVMPKGALLCPECLEALPFVQGPICRKCGKILEDGEQELCSDCREAEHVFDAGRGVFSYDEVMRKTIGQFKYHGRKEYARPLGILTARAMEQQLKIWKPQVIIPIPLYKKKLRMRGFNQTEEIGKVISAYTQIPMETRVLHRVRNTAAMKELNPEERRENMLRAFTCTEKEIPWEKILLLDDIYTTGSTMDAAAIALRQKKPMEIYCLSVCIGKGFMVQ
ncbi:MAG: ComF family protein [Lachnospiraceae bacterium]|nr:ComF family protein [Lachnospiraceae bacterium]